MELLNQLSDLDHLLLQRLEKNEIDAEDIAQLVDRREQLLSCFLQVLAQQPDLKHDPSCQQVVARTQTLVEKMQVETRRTGEQLYKLRHGQRSIQHYKKFL